MAEPPNDSDAHRTAIEPHWLFASLHARRGVLTSLAILAGLGLVAQAAWQKVRSQVAQNERYLVTPASLAVPPAPPWVRDDVVAEAFRLGGLTGELSVLDPPDELQQRLAVGLTRHPWVRRVGAIRPLPPNRLIAEVEYRTPVAVVMLSSTRTPTDVDGTALPSDTLATDYLDRLPRIGVASGSPREHAALPFRSGSWPTAQIAGAASLVAAFGSAFGELSLFEVQIDPVPGGGAGSPYVNYQLRSRGNTMVIWGAAPGLEPAGQATFETKLQRLHAAVEQHGRLDSVAVGPALIDVREGVNAFPRVVMKSEQRLASKPEEESPAVVK